MVHLAFSSCYFILAGIGQMLCRVIIQILKVIYDTLLAVTCAGQPGK